MADDFARLLAPCKNAVERYVFYKLPCRQDGEDVLQEVYLAAARNLGQLRDEGKFKPWILAIATNRVKAFYRAMGMAVQVPYADALIERPREGRGVIRAVRDTLADVPEADRALLRMAYWEGRPLAEIAAALDVPLGTVKSRLHAARARFRALYPYPPAKSKGGISMSDNTNKKPLPDILPEVSIRRLGAAKEAFLQELLGWFTVPRMGERVRWAIYDYPARSRSESYEMEAVCPCVIHGVEGVAIRWQETLTDGTPGLSGMDVGQLTDSHCRYLAVGREEEGVKRLSTFLDDDFTTLYRYAIGEDNCGLDVRLPSRGLIAATEAGYACPEAAELFDTVGRYEVRIGQRVFDTALIVYMERGPEGGVLSENYTDAQGRCVLNRRFNADDWRLANYGSPWQERLPENERILVNGETFVHWYDSVSDYAL